MESFTVLKWQFKTTPTSNKPASRQFFVKKHHIKSNQNDISPKIPGCGRTLLITNVPPLLSTTQIKSTFSNHFGLIEKIYLQDEPGKSGFQKYHNNTVFDSDAPESKLGIFNGEVKKLDCYGCAYIVFEKSESVDKIIGYDKVLKFDYAKIEENIKTIKISDKISDECDAYLDWFDNKNNQDDGEDDDGFEMVDDDEGWTEVGAKGIKFTEVNQKKGKNLADRKRKNMILPNFYAHQQREVKKKKIDLIREAYEDSKKQISEARKQRVYKPFS